MRPGIALPRQSRWSALRLRCAPGVTVCGDVRLGRGVRVRGNVTLGAGVALGDGTRIDASRGAVTIGAGTVLGEGCVLVSNDRIELGDGVVLGAKVAIVDFDHRYDDVERPIRVQGIVSAPVTVGSGAAIGHQAALLRGVTVAPNTVIPPGTVVRRRLLVPRGQVS